MNNTIHQQRGFLILYLLFLVGSTSIILFYHKVEIHSFMNSWNQPSLDSAMVLTTQLAEGIAIAVVIILGLSYRIQSGLFILFSTSLASLITQLLKRQVFPHLDRPGKVFEGVSEYSLRVVEGYELHDRFSFPSGHTTAAFALWLSASIVVNKPKISVGFAIIAIGIGYSRIYLSQHFLQDVVVGSLIGTVVTLFLAKIFYEKAFKTHWMNFGWGKNT